MADLLRGDVSHPVEDYEVGAVAALWELTTACDARAHGEASVAAPPVWPVVLHMAYVRAPPRSAFADPRRLRELISGVRSLAGTRGPFNKPSVPTDVDGLELSVIAQLAAAAANSSNDVVEQTLLRLASNSPDRHDHVFRGHDVNVARLALHARCAQLAFLTPVLEPLRLTAATALHVAFRFGWLEHHRVVLPALRRVVEAAVPGPEGNGATDRCGYAALPAAVRRRLAATVTIERALLGPRCGAAAREDYAAIGTALAADSLSRLRLRGARILWGCTLAAADVEWYPGHPSSSMPAGMGRLALESCTPLESCFATDPSGKDEAAWAHLGLVVLRAARCVADLDRCAAAGCFAWAASYVEAPGDAAVPDHGAAVAELLGVHVRGIDASWVQRQLRANDGSNVVNTLCERATTASRAATLELLRLMLSAECGTDAAPCADRIVRFLDKASVDTAAADGVAAVRGLLADRSR